VRDRLEDLELMTVAAAVLVDRHAIRLSQPAPAALGAQISGAPDARRGALRTSEPREMLRSGLRFHLSKPCPFTGQTVSVDRLFGRGTEAPGGSDEEAKRWVEREAAFAVDGCASP